MSSPFQNGASTIDQTSFEARIYHSGEVTKTQLTNQTAHMHVPHSYTQRQICT